jgi:gluconate 2-dehydrogenase gamma chain
MVRAMRADDADDLPPLGNFDRRTLLSGALVAVGGLGVACAPSSPPSSASETPPTSSTPAAVDGGDGLILVLVALADRLVPNDQLGPGAVAANVEAFFRQALADVRLSMIQPLLKKGCSFVQQLARSEHGEAFSSLGPAAKDAIITRLVDNTVRPDGFSAPTFIRVVMALTLEGYLGDPRHGGNARGIGWRVVGYAPEGRAQGLALQVMP